MNRINIQINIERHRVLSKLHCISHDLVRCAMVQLNGDPLNQHEL